MLLDAATLLSDTGTLPILQTAVTGADVYDFKSAPVHLTPSTWMNVCKHSAL